MSRNVFVLGALLAVSGASQAAFIEMPLANDPSVVSGGSDVTFNSQSRDIFIVGTAMMFTDASQTSSFITNGSFFLAGNVDTNGIPTSGGVVISGGLSAGRGSSELLSGVLTGFGFADGGGTLLQFKFSVAGGLLADQYGGLGSDFGILVDSGAAYSGDWSQDYNNLVDGTLGTGQGFSVASPLASIPTPSTAVILGLAAARWSRRRR